MPLSGSPSRLLAVQYEGSIRFGDNVRVCDTQATREIGLAGLIGQVYGETTPSVTGVQVIGKPRTDYAINVRIEGRKETYWFAADLLELVDHAPGTEIRVGSKRYVREADGQWRDLPGVEPRQSRPWWRFW